MPENATKSKKCDCISMIEAELDKHNTRLSLNFRFNRNGTITTFPIISTELKEKRRGMKPMKIMPSYCPWCGVKYDDGHLPN